MTWPLAPDDAFHVALAGAVLAPAQEPEAELRFSVQGHLRGERTGELHFMIDEIGRPICSS